MLKNFTRLGIFLVVILVFHGEGHQSHMSDIPDLVVLPLAVVGLGQLLPAIHPSTFEYPFYSTNVKVKLKVCL
jgi:hypothetical protein